MSISEQTTYNGTELDTSSRGTPARGTTAGRLVGYAAAAMLGVIGLLAPVAEPADAARPAAALGTIPDSAFLQPEDLGGSQGWRPDRDLRDFLRPPLPCDSGQYRSVTMRTVEDTMAFDYAMEDATHTVLLEHLARYEGVGAARYLSELGAMLSGRPCSDPTGEWALQETGVAGRDSMLIRLRERFEDPGGNPMVKSTYLIVARTGGTVVTLSDIGWESDDGHQALVWELIGPALARAGAVGGVVGGCAPPSRYQATTVDIQTDRAGAFAMNDRGQVVGQYTVRDDVLHGFLWENDRIRDLAVLARGTEERGIAHDINEHGDVVGGSHLADGSSRAVLWPREGGPMVNLGTLGGSYSFAEAINDRGQITGNSTTASGELRGFIWEDGRMRDLGIGGDAQPLDINNRGEIVGWSTLTGDGYPQQPFLWSRGTITLLPNPGQGQARSINELSEIVGGVMVPGEGVTRAVRWQGGRLIELGALPGGNASGARFINDLGQIVGSGNVRPYSIEEHAFLYQCGTMHDLTGPGVRPEHSYSLEDLNNRGQILTGVTIYSPVTGGSR